MKIEKIILNNFRTITNLEIGSNKNPLPKRIVIFGENGTGKSSLLELLATVGSIGLGFRSRFPKNIENEGSLEILLKLYSEELTDSMKKAYKKAKRLPLVREIEGINKLKYLSDKIEFNLKWNQGSYNFNNKYKLDNTDIDLGSIMGKRKIHHELGTIEYLPPERTLQANQQSVLQILEFFDSNLQMSRISRIDNLRNTTIAKYDQLLRQWGTLIQEDKNAEANFYNKMKQRTIGQTSVIATTEEIMSIHDNSNYKKISDAILKFLPEIRLAPKDEQKANPPTLVFETKIGKKLFLEDLSSGERQIIMWIIDLTHRKLANSIILWDEPDLHIHPSLIIKIPELVEDLCPNSQLWIATHSPFLVTSLEKDSLVIYLQGVGKKAIIGEEALIQGLRKVTPTEYLAALGRPILIVEGEEDRKFLTELIDKRNLAFTITPILGKPSIKRLNAILNELKEIWGRPLAIALLDRDQFENFSHNNFPSNFQKLR